MKKRTVTKKGRIVTAVRKIIAAPLLAGAIGLAACATIRNPAPKNTKIIKIIKIQDPASGRTKNLKILRIEDPAFMKQDGPFLSISKYWGRCPQEVTVKEGDLLYSVQHNGIITEMKVGRIGTKNVQLGTRCQKTDDKPAWKWFSLPYRKPIDESVLLPYRESMEPDDESQLSAEKNDYGVTISEPYMGYLCIGNHVLERAEGKE